VQEPASAKVLPILPFPMISAKGTFSESPKEAIKEMDERTGIAPVASQPLEHDRKLNNVTIIYPVDLIL
jgi:hypothetical protein